MRLGPRCNHMIDNGLKPNNSQQRNLMDSLQIYVKKLNIAKSEEVWRHRIHTLKQHLNEHHHQNNQQLLHLVCFRITHNRTFSTSNKVLAYLNKTKTHKRGSVPTLPLVLDWIQMWTTSAQRIYCFNMTTALNPQLLCWFHALDLKDIPCT